MEIKNKKRKITAGRLLVAGAIGSLLYFAHVAFVPVALALLIALVLSGPVECMHSLKVPRSASAALILVSLIGILIALGNFISAPAQQWFAAAPHTVRLIERKIRPVAQVMQRVGELRNSAGSIVTGPTSTAAPTVPPAAPAATAPGEESAPAMLLDATKTAVLSTVTVIILTLFLLAGGPPMLARMIAAFASDLKSAHMIAVIEKVRREVGRFYVTSAFINIGVGIVTGCVMMLCGMPNPFLWGNHGGVVELHSIRGSDRHAAGFERGRNHFFRQFGSHTRSLGQLPGNCPPLKDNSSSRFLSGGVCS